MHNKLIPANTVTREITVQEVGDGQEKDRSSIFQREKKGKSIWIENEIADRFVDVKRPLD